MAETAENIPITPGKAETRHVSGLHCRVKVAIERSRPYQYRLPADGRKWRVQCLNRQKLTLYMSGFCEFCVGLVKIAKDMDWHRSTVARVMSDLEYLGVVKTLGYSSKHGTRIRKLCPAALSESATPRLHGSASEVQRKTNDEEKKIGEKDSAVAAEVSESATPNAREYATQEIPETAAEIAAVTAAILAHASPELFEIYQEQLRRQPDLNTQEVAAFHSDQQRPGKNGRFCPDISSAGTVGVYLGTKVAQFFAPPGLTAADRRTVLCAQLRLLASRIEHNLPVDFRSVLNLLRVVATSGNSQRSFNRGP